MKLKKSFTGFKKVVAKLKDTGNGVILKFPSLSSVQQDNYICLDYAEAAYAYKLLKKFAKKEKERLARRS
jgi:hypothetical protein